MKMEIDFGEHLGSAIRQDLEEHAMYLLTEGNDPNEFIGCKAQLFASFCDVIQYYSTPKEFEEFVKRTKGKKVE